MVNYEYADLFVQDSNNKQLNIAFDSGVITNEELHSENFELKESICSEEQLRFGSCEASSVKFKISNIVTPLKGKQLVVTETIAGNTDVPFSYGEYKVFSDKPTADRRYRDVVAYDVMYDIIHADVAEWYNTILPDANSEVPLKELRDSFFEYFGIEQEEVTLVNDSMTVQKTIETTSLSGKVVITAICEINGCFGHIGRNGKFQYIFLKEMGEGLYPSDTLYPRDDLFPRDAKNVELVSRSHYISAKYEDFTTAKIDKLQIRQEEDDIGVIHGTGDNCYIVQDNFLVYGKGSEELATIAANLYSVICNVWYRPAHVEAKGNPCLEVGDGIRLGTMYETVYTYILQRTLKGIQALRDTYDAEGEQYQRKDVNSTHESLIQLKAKTNKLSRTLEETRSEIASVERKLEDDYSTTEEMNSAITQRADSFTVEVNKQISETKTYADAVATTAKNEAISSANSYSDSELSTYKDYVDENFKTIQSQLDGQIESHFYDYEPTLNNLPASEWTTEEQRKEHEGDLFFWTSKGYSYRFFKDGATWGWQLIEDSDVTKALAMAEQAQDTADSKRRIFVITPYAPYDIGDLWCQEGGDILVCTTAKSATGNYAASDWQKYNKYTDEATAKALSDQAESNANSATDEKLKSYSTTVEMNSAIKAKADEISLNVSKTYTTKTETSAIVSSAKSEAISVASQDATIKADNALASANSNTAELLKSYSTTTEMKSAIALSANDIKLEVAQKTTVYGSNQIKGSEAGKIDLSYFNKSDYAISTTLFGKQCIYPDSGISQSVTLLPGQYIFSYNWLRTEDTTSFDAWVWLTAEDEILGETYAANHGGVNVGNESWETVYFDLEVTKTTKYNLNVTCNRYTGEHSFYITNIMIVEQPKSINTAIKDATAQIAIQADEISLKVSADEVVNSINVSKEGIAIRANRIDLVGIVESDTFISKLIEAEKLVAKFATVSQLEAEIARINKIESNYISAGSVAANYASISSLNAATARISTIEANYITAGTVSANYATISSLNAVDAKFGNLNANNIKSGTLSADRIDVSGIINSNTFKGAAITVYAVYATTGFTYQGTAVKWGNINGVRVLMAS